MIEAPCRSCLERGPDHVQLVHDSTGERMAICPRCLRSQLRMKADVGDQRGRGLLQGYAEEYEWHVWRSPNVLYLLPSMVPSTHRAAPMPRPGKPLGVRA